MAWVCGRRHAGEETAHLPAVADCPVVAGLRITEALAGKHLLVTGVTGFVGEALLERVLYDLPDTRVTVLVRPRGGTSAEDRTRHLLTKPAFERLRQRDGEENVDALVGTRIRILDGDLDDVPPLPGDLDVVVHCAGEVSFDPPIHEGFATNLHGTLHLLDAIHASGSRPHYVHVSTAYVAGRRQGYVTEGRLDHHVDWRAEAAAALRVRDAVEVASRSPDQLAEFLRDAEREHVTSGPLTGAQDAERRRTEWVAKRLVGAGRERGRPLGRTDCYP